MLISESLIFVHYPKTGGSSVQAYIEKALPNKYYPADDATLANEEKAWLTHQGLAVAYQYAIKLGFDPFKIPTIVCIRNPYNLMLSGYKYLVHYCKDRIDNLEGTYSEYLLNLSSNTPADILSKRAGTLYGPYTSHLTIRDLVPSNVTIARTESLSEDVAKFLKNQVGVRPAFDFPHKNKTEHQHFSHYYTKAEERIVFKMWENTFDSRLYDRFEGLDRLRGEHTGAHLPPCHGLA